MLTSIKDNHPNFYPRPPRGGRPSCWCPCKPSSSYFYPRPPRGGRLFSIVLDLVSDRFLSTPSARRATFRLSGFTKDEFLFLSTPSARRATHVDAKHHARQHISIHALREEGDSQFHSQIRHLVPFLSTPSARRATTGLHFTTVHEQDFYPRPPRGGRRPRRNSPPKPPYFYPRPPRGGRPGYLLGARVEMLISIHALREEGDEMAQRASARNLSISIHALREEGDVESHFRGQQVPVFLSTPSARRATTRCCGPC